MPTNLSTKHPIARKEHRCSDCSRAIPKGTQYENQSCVADGSAYTWKSCRRCSIHAIVAMSNGWCPDQGIPMIEFIHEDAYARWAQYRLEFREAESLFVRLGGFPR